MASSSGNLPTNGCKCLAPETEVDGTTTSDCNLVEKLRQRKVLLLLLRSHSNDDGHNVDFGLPMRRRHQRQPHIKRQQHQQQFSGRKRLHGMALTYKYYNDVGGYYSQQRLSLIRQRRHGGGPPPAVAIKTRLLSFLSLLVVQLLCMFAGQVTSLSMPKQPSTSASTTTRETADPNFKKRLDGATTSNVPDIIVGPYLKWNNKKKKNYNGLSSSSSWEMQTKITTFQKGDQTVELHAQLHYGDRAYYEYWNDPAFNSKFDKVLFELLVDESLLQENTNDGTRHVQQAIMASPNDQAVAAQYGWQCQASSIDYQQQRHGKKQHWIHADLSRQEFVALAADAKDKQKHGRGYNNNNNSNMPLWKLASPEASSSSTAAEAVAAFMVGPPVLSYSTPYLPRRLFTNLFLPGESLAFSLRYILWWTVPAPELSIILLDWASVVVVLPSSSSSSSRGTSAVTALSEIALPILTSLLQFNIPQLRRFLFGQVLVSSSSLTTSATSRKNPAWSLLVTERNDRALQVLEQILLEESSSSTTKQEKVVKSVALLYGSSHCPDLHRKLVQKGFVPTATLWRTAWSVEGSSSSSNTGVVVDDDRNSNGIGSSTTTATVLPALVALLSFYLIVGALDWVNMLGDVSLALEKADYVEASLQALFYLIRHVLLYLGLSNVLVDWTNSNTCLTSSSDDDD